MQDSTRNKGRAPATRSARTVIHAFFFLKCLAALRLTLLHSRVIKQGTPMSRIVSELPDRWNISVRTRETYHGPTPDSIAAPHQDAPTAKVNVEHGSAGMSEDDFDDRLLEVFTTAADTIIPHLHGDLASDLRKELAAWSDVHGLNPLDQRVSRTIVARQAVFNLWLKATLYEWYHDHSDLPPLPSDTRVAFQQAKDRTECPDFGEYVLDEVVHLASRVHLEAVVAERHRLLDSAEPADVIGRLYEALLPNESRRTLGQFRTPKPVGRLMRAWATSGGDTVLDPGIGSAALSSPGFPGWVLSSAPDQVYGIDRSPLSRLMGTVTLTLVGQEHTTQTSDFFAVAPEQLPETIDAIVCNPPYVRYNELSTEYRSVLNEQAERLTGHVIPGKTPLHGYFLYHAGTYLSCGDRMAVIVPHHFLHREYGAMLKRYLLDRFRIHALALYDPTNESLFDTADTTALLLFLEATSQDEPYGTTHFIHIEDVENTEWHRELETETSGTRDWGRVIHVEQSELQPEKDWTKQFNPLTVDTTNLTPLSEIADITRGISTGDNGFFCLSQEEVERHGIDERQLQPLIRTVSKVSGYEFRDSDWRTHREAGGEAWLLYLDDLDDVPHDLVEAKATRETWGGTNMPKGESDQFPAGVYAYLYANIPDISSKKLQNRSPWYRVDRRDSPQIVIQTLSRNGFNAVLNYSSALILNNGNGIYPDESMTQDEIKALAAFLNSSVADEILQHHAETRASGAERLTSGTLGNVEVVDPRTVDPGIVAKLAALFDELSVNDSEESDVVERIDAILAEHVL